MKKLLLVFGGAALVFLVVYYLKMNTDMETGTVSYTEELPAADRQKVLLFWEVYRKATRLRIAGKVEESRDAYKRALELNPNHEDALYYYGNMSLETDRAAEAKSAWQRLIAENPGSARAFFRLGDLFLDHERAYFDIDSAAWCYHKVLDLNKEQSAPVLRLAEVAILRGNRTEADRYLDAVLGYNPRSSQAHFLKGYLFWKDNGTIDPERKQQFLQSLEVEKPLLDILGEGDTKGGGSLFDRNRHIVFGVDLMGQSQGPGDDLAAKYRRLDQAIQTLRNKRPS